ncbi:MAG: hypothetical protein M1827_002882 [Pycnora praestabilis]|nr:MAG: hypothetical protein M1827_002882 [Pycnora praestabilis]
MAAMAIRQVNTLYIPPSLFLRLSTANPSMKSRSTTLFTRQLTCALLPSLSIAVPAAVHISIPSLLSGIWESILRAVPKKKTSHMKKRHRQMAGKALKDVTSLNKCSACGSVKRAHLLCPYCVADIKNMWLGKEKKGAEGKTTA